MPADRIACLDGLRGLAALWVLLGHALILTGWRVPIVSRPDLAVDLFMMLSGFLMTFHYLERRAQEPWGAPSTWRVFWVRRFFRIAPLYYLLLALALFAGPGIGADRDAIAAVLPQTATASSRYLDQSWGNVLAHLTFAFGFHPYYGFNTPLPDWSIGLEMAFYAAFPFLMAVAARTGLLLMAIPSALSCTLLSLLFPDFFRAFQEPSLLAIKLPIFLAGMLVAASLQARGRERLVLLAAALALCLLPVRGSDNSALAYAIRSLCLTVMTLLIDAGRVPFGRFGPIVQWFAARMGGRPATFLGDSSYAVYLLHLLAMVPVIALVLAEFPSASPRVHFLLTVAIVIPIVYLSAWLLHITVERPGIQLGRHIIGQMRRHRSLRKAPADLA